MARVVARHIEPGMLGLVVVEMGLAFTLGYLVLEPAGFNHFSGSAAYRAAVVAGSVGFTSFVLGLYRPEAFRRVRSLLGQTVLGALLAFPAVWLVSRLFGLGTDWIVGPDSLWPTKILVAWVAALVAVRLAVAAAVRLGLFVRPVAILGPTSQVSGAVAAIRSGRAGLREIVGLEGRDGTPGGLRAAGVRTALIPAGAELGPALREAFAAAGIEVQAEPVFWERQLSRVDVDHLVPEWFAEVDAKPVSRLQETVARLIDVLLSLGLLLFTLPLILLVALAVVLDSRGPVLYRQERVGLGGRPFIVLKFRSMRTDAEMQGPVWAQQRDKRVTRVGSVMRRTRIDELPQLLNILGGSMSFIGPRPERPHFVETLEQAIPYYRERTRVKPGLTGWAQVNYPYGASIEDARQKLSYDLYYVRHRSPMLDVMILFATVRVIVFQEGAR